MIEGLFIVIEGIDAAGTTTHTRLLTQYLRSRGLPVLSTREPSDGPIGMLIRQILTGRLVVPGIAGARPSSWNTMALLFAADRMDHVEATVAPNLHDGVTVVSDRYYHSSIAYQSVTSGAGADAIDWVRTLNKHARKPDLTLVLDVSSETSANRRKDRPMREMYDDGDLQAQLAAFYDDIESHFPDENIVHLNAERSIEEVAADVQRQVRILRNEE